MGSALSAPGDLPQHDYIQAIADSKAGWGVVVNDAPEMKGCTKPYRNGRYPQALVDNPFPDMKAEELNMWSVFQRGVKTGKVCLGARAYQADGKRGDYVTWSYAEVSKEALEISSGLLSLGFVSPATVGVFSINRPEWTMSLLACAAQGFVCVPLYDTLGPEAIDYILSHAEVRVAFCEKKKLSTLIKSVEKKKDDSSVLRYVIQFDEHPKLGNKSENVSEEDKKKLAELGIKLMGWTELRAAGAAALAEAHPPAPEKLLYIMYTSGTTGVPKGVMITHQNLMAGLSGASAVLTANPDDIHFSYLPLAHIFEAIVEVSLLAFGASIYFFQGDIKLVKDDLLAVRPTIFCGVPRVYTRFYAQIMDALKSKMCLIRNVALNALAEQTERLRSGKPVDPSAGNFVFSKVRAGLGMDRVRVMVTGAAPCPAHIMEFFKIVVNPKDGFMQGYGMTETAAILCSTHPSDLTIGHVGPPLPCVEIRLRDVPEMGYLSTNNPPAGEIIARGKNIFQGYYKNEDATRETLEDGWIGTGDIGRFYPNGNLVIVDRKKNIFKLAQGEYVAAEKIEAVYQKVPWINQIWVYGNSFRTFLVAVVVADAMHVQRHAKEQKWWPAEHADTKLASPEGRATYKKVVEEHRDELHDLIANLMEAEAKASGLHGFEKVKDFIFETTLDENLVGFNVENDCMTPTFKLRRPYLLSRYEQPLRDLYTKNGEAPEANEVWVKK